MVRLALMADSASQPPTYPQSSAPSTFLHSRHKEEDYVTVGSVQHIAPTVTALSSLFFCLSCSGLTLFCEVLFQHFLISGGVSLFVLFSFFSPWRAFYLLGETFPQRRGEEGLACIQLLTRTSCCCSCWVEVEGQSQSPVHEYTQANTVKKQGWEVLTSAGIAA